MADKKSHLNWILEELPRLNEAGLLDDETAQKLAAHYGNKLQSFPSRQKIFSLLLGLLGILMISGGIILFFNHNWDMFPKVLRILISALPLGIGAVVSYWTLCREKGQLWREASAVLTAAGTVVLIAMLSQIYHINGELADFVFLVLLLSVPLLYIFNSIGLLTLYVFFSFFINQWTAPCWQNFLLYAVLLPFFFRHLREASSWTVWCRYLVLPGALSLVLGCGAYSLAAMFILASSLLLAAGMDELFARQDFWRTPWFVPAFICQTILLAIGSSADDFSRPFLKVPVTDLWIFWLVSALGAGLLIRILLKRPLTAGRLLPAVLTGAAFILPFVEPFWGRLFYNVYLGLAGIFYLREGLLRRSILLFNGGAVMIVVLVMCRFFDADIGLLYRACGLILLGSGFIAANIFYIRRHREEVNQ